MDFFSGERLSLEGDLDSFLERLETESRTKKTVVLASGDPNFFGLAKRLLEKIPPERVRICPSTTAVQEAFARLKATWAGTETASLHGRDSWPLFWAALYRAGRSTGSGYLAVFNDPRNNPAAIARAMLDRKISGWKINVFQDLGTEREKIACLALEEASLAEFSPLSLSVLERTENFRPISLGAPEQAYRREAGLITKSEIRCAALGLLELTGTETLWDIGAGSGALSLEAASLLPYGRVIAVEKNPGRLSQIEENRREFGAAHLETHLGEALELMPGLARPDRIFVGGGGQDLESILEAAKGRLSPGGVLVASAITLSALQAAEKALSRPERPSRISLIWASRSRSLAGSLYFRPLNQIWLVKNSF
jgi:precorrin-6Y C5,15-methyltransferase (decarboxylating)